MSALCDFTVYRLIDYQRRADFPQSRNNESALEILLQSQHDGHYIGSHVVSVNDVGIYARIECAETGSNKATTYIALVRFDKQEAWLVNPGIGRFTWVKFSDIQKFIRKQAANRNKDWGTGWVDETKSALRRFRQPVVLVDSLVAGWPGVDDLRMTDSANASRWRANLALGYTEDPKDDSLRLQIGCSATVGTSPLTDTLRHYRERLETDLLLQPDSGITRQFPLDMRYDDLVTPLLRMFRSDSLGRHILINETTFDSHYLDRGGMDSVGDKRIYKEKGTAHQTVRLATVDYIDVPNEKFRLPKHLKRIVQRDLDIERILAMILL